MRERGITLVEVVIVAAIVVLIAAASLWLAQGARAYGMRSATRQFDAVLGYAQALAATSGNGATLVFTSPASGDGFVLTVYSGRPDAPGAIHLAPMAPLTSAGNVREAKLGAVPFTIFLNGAGHASGTAEAVTPRTVLTSDPGCPPGESSIVLTFSDPRATDTRTITCNAAVAGAPVPVGTVNP
ncbi:MAG TPA: hypothetical protein VKT72_02765 [Candidatus Baltobacteraceae bacterium]|nr:hypothetical protein [Candidatus Baltobacteraceae bacterium]